MFYILHSAFLVWPDTRNQTLDTDESGMKKSDIILIILAAALVIGMLLTAIFGRGSRHGYGSTIPDKTPLYGRHIGPYL